MRRRRGRKPGPRGKGNSRPLPTPETSSGSDPTAASAEAETDEGMNPAAAVAAVDTGGEQQQQQDGGGGRVLRSRRRVDTSGELPGSSGQLQGTSGHLPLNNSPGNSCQGPAVSSSSVGGVRSQSQSDEFNVDADEMSRDLMDCEMIGDLAVEINMSDFITVDEVMNMIGDTDAEGGGGAKVQNDPQRQLHTPPIDLQGEDSGDNTRMTRFKSRQMKSKSDNDNDNSTDAGTEMPTELQQVLDESIGEISNKNKDLPDSMSASKEDQPDVLISAVTRSNMGENTQHDSTLSGVQNDSSFEGEIETAAIEAINENIAQIDGAAKSDPPVGDDTLVSGPNQEEPASKTDLTDNRETEGQSVSTELTCVALDDNVNPHPVSDLSDNCQAAGDQSLGRENENYVSHDINGSSLEPDTKKLEISSEPVHGLVTQETEAQQARGKKDSSATETASASLEESGMKSQTHDNTEEIKSEIDLIKSHWMSESETDSLKMITTTAENESNMDTSGQDSSRKVSQNVLTSISSFGDFVGEGSQSAIESEDKLKSTALSESFTTEMNVCKVGDVTGSTVAIGNTNQQTTAVESDIDTSIDGRIDKKLQTPSLDSVISAETVPDLTLPSRKSKTVTESVSMSHSNMDLRPEKDVISQEMASSVVPRGGNASDSDTKVYSCMTQENYEQQHHGEKTPETFTADRTTPAYDSRVKEDSRSYDKQKMITDHEQYGPITPQEYHEQYGPVTPQQYEQQLALKRKGSIEDSIEQSSTPKKTRLTQYMFGVKKKPVEAVPTVVKEIPQETKSSSMSNITKLGFTIMVGNIPAGTKAAEVKLLFEAYGKVLNAKILGKSKDPKAPVFAQITMEMETETDIAVRDLHKCVFKGNKIVVKKKSKPEDKSQEQTDVKKEDHTSKTKQPPPKGHTSVPPTDPMKLALEKAKAVIEAAIDGEEAPVNAETQVKNKKVLEYKDDIYSSYEISDTYPGKPSQKKSGIATTTTSTSTTTNTATIATANQSQAKAPKPSIDLSTKKRMQSYMASMMNAKSSGRKVPKLASKEAISDLKNRLIEKKKQKLQALGVESVPQVTEEEEKAARAAKIQASLAAQAELLAKIAQAQATSRSEITEHVTNSTALVPPSLPGLASTLPSTSVATTVAGTQPPSLSAPNTSLDTLSTVTTSLVTPVSSATVTSPTPFKTSFVSVSISPGPPILPSTTTTPGVVDIPTPGGSSALTPGVSAAQGITTTTPSSVPAPVPAQIPAPVPTQSPAPVPIQFPAPVPTPAPATAPGVSSARMAVMEMLTVNKKVPDAAGGPPVSGDMSSTASWTQPQGASAWGSQGDSNNSWTQPAPQNYNYPLHGPQGQGYNGQGQGYHPQGQGHYQYGQGYHSQGQGYNSQGQGYQQSPHGGWNQQQQPPPNWGPYPPPPRGPPRGYNQGGGWYPPRPPMGPPGAGPWGPGYSEGWNRPRGPPPQPLPPGQDSVEEEEKSEVKQQPEPVEESSTAASDQKDAEDLPINKELQAAVEDDDEEDGKTEMWQSLARAWAKGKMDYNNYCNDYYNNYYNAPQYGNAYGGGGGGGYNRYPPPPPMNMQPGYNQHGYPPHPQTRPGFPPRGPIPHTNFAGNTGYSDSSLYQDNTHNTGQGDGVVEPRTHPLKDATGNFASGTDTANTSAISNNNISTVKRREENGLLGDLTASFTTSPGNLDTVKSPPFMSINAAPPVAPPIVNSAPSVEPPDGVSQDNSSNVFGSNTGDSIVEVDMDIN